MHDQGVSQPPVHPFVQPTVIDPAGPTATWTQKPESAASEPAVEFSSIGPGVDPKHDVTQAIFWCFPFFDFSGAIAVLEG